MADVSFRPAQKSDCRTIAELYSISSGGVAEYIWTKLARPGEALLDVGRRRYEREDSLFSYRNCTIVESNGTIAGMLIAFPMQSEFGEETDPVLVPYRKLEEPGSYYICDMAMFPEFRGLGIGSRLLELAEAQARERGLSKMSLIVFEENAGAKRLYERFGYRESARHPVYPHPLVRYRGDAVLMVKTLD